MIPILLYHSISDEVAPGFRLWSLSPNMFREHMRHLRDNAYNPLTVTDFVKLNSTPGAKLPEKPVIVTFDDGLADFYTGALPILREFSIPATLYIATKYIDKTSRWLQPEGEGDRPMLTWSQIDEVNAAKVECGAHSHTHPQLDTISIKKAREEITLSKKVLEDHFGKPVQSFAYPHGHHSRAVRQAVIDAGFTSACAVKNAMSSRHDDHFALARYTITVDDDVNRLRKVLAGEGLRVAPFPEHPKTTIWRFVRRTKFTFNQLLNNSKEANIDHERH